MTKQGWLAALGIFVAAFVLETVIVSLLPGRSVVDGLLIALIVLPIWVVGAVLNVRLQSAQRPQQVEAGRRTHPGSHLPVPAAGRLHDGVCCGPLALAQAALEVHP